MAMTDILGSFNTSTPPPNVNSQTATTVSAPQFYTDYLSSLANQGASAVQSGGVAPLGPLTQEAINMAPSTAMSYQPFLTSAGNTLNTASTPTDQIASQFMSPFQKNVIDTTQKLGQQNISNIITPQSIALGVGSGNFDTGASSEAANAIAQNQSQAETALTNTLGNLENQGWTSSMQEAQNYLNNLLGVGGQQINAANTAGTQGTNALSTLAGLGSQQQQQAQNQLNYPMQAAINESQLLKGYSIPTNTTANVSGPLAGATYGPSPLSQLAALFSGAMGTPTGTAGSNTNALSMLGSGLSSLLGLGSGTNPGGTNASNQYGTMTPYGAPTGTSTAGAGQGYDPTQAYYSDPSSPTYGQAPNYGDTGSTSGYDTYTDNTGGYDLGQY